MSDVIAPAKPDIAQLQKALGQVNQSMLPGNKEQCPSCDKTGLAILVTLYGVIPTQNYSESRMGYDWVTYMDGGGFFDSAGYLAARKLNQAKAGGMIECSQYVLRTLRKGYLYIHYPDDKSWEIYAVQEDGRLMRMQLDMGHAMGIGDAACARFKREAGAFLLTVDPKKHPTFYAAFSDAKWTKNVREKVVQPSPAAYMKLVHTEGQRELAPVGENVIKNTVLGFQDRPMLTTAKQEAYPRVPCTAPTGIYETMVRLNKPYNDRGALILALEDDIGIATQLNFLRNSALLDIMGEGDGYSEDDKNKMATAGLMQNLKDGLGEIWSSIEDNIDKKQFDSYLQRFTACEDAKANFDALSADYTQWMQFLLGRKLHRLFDPEVPEIGLQLGTIVGDLFEGAGLGNDEFKKVLLPQFTADATSENQLFWRGAAANDSKLLALLADPSIDKTILEGRKKYGEGKEQIALLREVREVRAETIKHNEASWARLSRVLATRARYLHDIDAKTFRRTLRKIQAVALATEDIGILIASAQGDATGYLNLLWQEQIAHTESGGKIKLTPKNQGQTFALMAWLARAWRPGQPAPEGLVEAANALNISLDDIPKLKRPTIEEAPATKGGMRMLIGLNASLAVVQAYTLYSNLSDLGVDLHKAQTADFDGLQMTKDLLSASSAFLGTTSSGFEIAAVASQWTSKGAKSATFVHISLTAGKLGLIGSIIEVVSGSISVAELWAKGDRDAAFDKAANVGFGAASSGMSYVALRMMSRATMEALANPPAGSAAGEIAAEAAAGSAAARAGATVSVEVPTAAVVLPVVSVGLWLIAAYADRKAIEAVTTPWKLWARRSFLGSPTRSSVKVETYADSKHQLVAMLRLLYTVKIKEPSFFSLETAIEVSVPSFGAASELDVNIYPDKNSGSTAIAKYKIEGKEKTIGGATNLVNGASAQNGIKLHPEIERSDSGVTIRVLLGDSWKQNVLKSMEQAVNPLQSLYGTAGQPSTPSNPWVEVAYWPNRAADDKFFVDGRTTEEAEADETKAAANTQAKKADNK